MGMFARQRSLAALLLGSVIAAGCSRDPSTPEAKRAKTEELLKAMSASLASAKNLTVDTVEARERVRATGEKITENSRRHIAIRRPDGVYYRINSDTHDSEAWYDGKRLTLAMHKDKAWARGPMPGTLDEALDYLDTEYAIAMPSADLFYSNPYESYDPAATKGGWTARETIDGATCHHLAFEGPLVNWQIWIADTPHALPCRLKITYKNVAGSPSSDLTFRNWNLAPTLPADAFTAKVDPGYERLYLVRAPTAEPTDDTAAQEPATAAGAAKKR